LIIDEINRGNIAKIFGELYFLLEYRDESIRLQYSRDEEFKLPRNLFIIGTMNTADRSIALVDSALRRRFYFMGLIPTREPIDRVLDGWLEAHGLDPEPAALLSELNRAIDDEDFSIGPSYFMTSDGTAPNLERIWTHAVMPLLEEQYYGTGRDLESEFGLGDPQTGRRCRRRNGWRAGWRCSLRHGPTKSSRSPRSRRLRLPRPDSPRSSSTNRPTAGG
jgi:5-methylcytosine-specific restriction protein B